MYGVIALLSGFFAAGSLDMNEPGGVPQAIVAGVVFGVASFKHYQEMKRMGFFLPQD